MKWPTLSVTMSQRRFSEMQDIGIFESTGLTKELEAFRDEFLRELAPFEELMKQNVGAFDVACGLVLYRVLSQSGFDVRTAADNGVWRFFSIKLLPDLVAKRWKQVPESRFFSGRSRIWLRAIWWTVHLTWQGTEARTREILATVTTDTIVQLVERPGRAGFRVELTRRLFSERNLHNPSQEQFRAIMKLNTAKILILEPSFHEGGMVGYVRRLFKEAGCDNALNAPASIKGEPIHESN
ncbi:hypothetical protein [Pseudomonas sp. CCI3.1]|uniref:hypothetical protein n=1 Tax=Pseudomonas sp. CCI3.1 TaxID=3048618 RepID=UPI002AB4118A|nr:MULTISPECIES: hypothetical protein [unclassified Pseudomonas]MDY7581297.1 hypothetical protein [Pseudomonas sp. CCI3.1]MEB0068208.1 hypothetical protein [Pseudomonas sp. CCI3.1]MEB0072580.1 hypothetical protein [Pseudomonas sp. CCI1.4]